MVLFHFMISFHKTFILKLMNWSFIKKSCMIKKTLFDLWMFNKDKNQDSVLWSDGTKKSSRPDRVSPEFRSSGAVVVVDIIMMVKAV